ncbi:C2 domain [Pseudocohnilembus persalinus]|uniref:C2 domain n=1 Tax=Pseudocohnilembus persalinus TaxID=266149 RepID=A0A0V0QT51_PSEPJ|nr:C2 domain [Pseudocohnilembus persalinus]|eukprot:KRX05399.1 C2 domain [Pseudocohnilembus persalinus]
MQGNLQVKPLSANLVRDTEFGGKMDPYVKLKIGSSLFKTKPHHGGGKRPTWGETGSMRINKGDYIMEIEIWDKDFGPDDMIAQGSFPLNKLEKSCHSQEWINLTYKGKHGGQILIDMQYFPDGGQKVKGNKIGQQGFQQYPQQQPQQQFYQQPPQQQMYNQPPQQQMYNQPPQQQYYQQPPPQQQYYQQPPTQQQYQQYPQQNFNQPQQQQQNYPMQYNQPPQQHGQYGQYPNQQGGYPPNNPLG